MALPIVAAFPWVVSLFGTVLGSLFTWAVTFFATRAAARFAIVTAYVIAVAALTVAVAVGVKALILGIQVSMPNSLGQATYFLPNNINLIMGAYFAMRISYYLYTWTSERLALYMRTVL